MKKKTEGEREEHEEPNFKRLLVLAAVLRSNLYDLDNNSLIFLFFQSYWPSRSTFQLFFDSATSQSKVPSRMHWIDMGKKPNVVGLYLYF